MGYSGKTKLNFIPEGVVTFSKSGIKKSCKIDSFICQFYYSKQTFKIFWMKLHHHVFYFAFHIHINYKPFTSTCTNFNKIWKPLEDDFMQLRASDHPRMN